MGVLRKVLVLAMAALLVVGAPAAAAEMSGIHNMEGTWISTEHRGLLEGKMETRGIDIGDVMITDSATKHVFEVTQQDGEFFIGTRHFYGVSESIMGMVERDSQRMYILDEDGYMFCDFVDSNTFVARYMEVKPDSRVLARLVFRRTK